MTDQLQIDDDQQILDLKNQRIQSLELQAQLPNVKILILSQNNLSNLKFLFYLKNLKFLHMDNCNLQDNHFDHVDKEFTQLQQLQCLVVRNNKLEMIRNFSPTIKIMNLSNNPLIQSTISLSEQYRPQLKLLQYGSLESQYLNDFAILKCMFLSNIRLFEKQQLSGVQISADYQNKQICINFKNIENQYINQNSVKISLFYIIRNYEIKLISQENIGIQQQYIVNTSLFKQLEFDDLYLNQNNIRTKLEEQLKTMKLTATQTDLFGIVVVEINQCATLFAFNSKDEKLFNLHDFSQFTLQQSQIQLSLFKVQTSQQQHDTLTLKKLIQQNNVKNQSILEFSREQLQLLNYIYIKNAKINDVYLISYFVTKQPIQRIISDIGRFFASYYTTLQNNQIMQILQKAFEQVCIGGQKQNNIVYDDKNDTFYLKLIFNNTKNNQLLQYNLELQYIFRTTLNESIQLQQQTSSRYLICQIYKSYLTSEQILISNDVIQPVCIVDSAKLNYYSKRKIFKIDLFYKNKQVLIQNTKIQLIKDNNIQIYQLPTNYCLAKSYLQNNYFGDIKATVQCLSLQNFQIGNIFQSNTIQVQNDGVLKSYKLNKIKAKLFQDTTKKAKVVEKQPIVVKQQEIKKEEVITNNEPPGSKKSPTKANSKKAKKAKKVTD